jgi:hypothetical protein
VRAPPSFMARKKGKKLVLVAGFEVAVKQEDMRDLFFRVADLHLQPRFSRLYYYE